MNVFCIVTQRIICYIVSVYLLHAQFYWMPYYFCLWSYNTNIIYRPLHINMGYSWNTCNCLISWCGGYKCPQWYPSKLNILSYLGESKVLQYSADVRHKLAALDNLAEVMKVTNYTGLWYAEITWYSRITIRWIFFYGLKHVLRTHGLRPTWPCLIIKALVIKAKFLDPYYDQLCLHLSRNKCFCFLLQH